MRRRTALAEVEPVDQAAAEVVELPPPPAPADPVATIEGPAVWVAPRLVERIWSTEVGVGMKGGSTLDAAIAGLAVAMHGRRLNDEQAEALDWLLSTRDRRR